MPTASQDEAGGQGCWAKATVEPDATKLQALWPRPLPRPSLYTGPCSQNSLFSNRGPLQRDRGLGLAQAQEGVRRPLTSGLAPPASTGHP